ncbi:hypothetical protein BGZ46_008228 [Entomortierella lignicola]|nr:hypothetical protein BGZ46_008228 [Entomortierella lignicola]
MNVPESSRQGNVLQPEESYEEDEEYDRYKNNPELLGEEIPKTARLFSFDWASGYISPFRPTPQDILSNLLCNVKFSTPGRDFLLDLGCGDSLVLLQALETFPKSQLVRAVGVDLDRPLLESTRDKILNSKLVPSNDFTTNDEYDISSRLELYHGDLMNRDETLSPVLSPYTIAPSSIHEAGDGMTMRRLLHDCSHLFVYLLPEALSKLAPILLEALIQGKIVLSMQWEIPELKSYQTHGGADQRYYIYST